MPFEVRTLAEWETSGIDGMLSVLIPAHNEEGHIAGTVTSIARALRAAGYAFEILVVNDNSRDDTVRVLTELAIEVPELRVVDNLPPNGFGFAIRRGLSEFRGEAVAIVMADGSDDADDVVRFFRKYREGYDCVFGSRFVAGGKVIDYPLPKLLLNRLGNTVIRALFLLRYNDMTNAFKLYSRRAVAGMQPLLAHHFNLTVEMPLKCLIRGFTYAVVPNTWRNRKEGLSKFKIREMGSRYMFIIIYCLVERILSRGDYKAGALDHAGRLQVWPR
ncbi:MAG TPA: glycosyltransferase family 2 protein [Stellaceae bacterium]|nr:glycosyltransferase family 2 protein [Stellaceae bacterium]